MDDKKQQVLAMVYTAHKREIIVRHLLEHLTGALNLFVFTALAAAFILLRYKGLIMSVEIKVMITLGMVIIADVLAYFLVKNYNRQNQIQKAIVNIDEALGLFKEGEFLPQGAVYPEKWKKHGDDRPWSSVSRCLVVLSSAVIAAIILWLI